MSRNLHSEGSQSGSDKVNTLYIYLLYSLSLSNKTFLMIDGVNMIALNMFSFGQKMRRLKNHPGKTSLCGCMTIFLQLSCRFCLSFATTVLRCITEITLCYSARSIGNFQNLYELLQFKYT